MHGRQTCVCLYQTSVLPIFLWIDLLSLEVQTPRPPFFFFAQQCIEASSAWLPFESEFYRGPSWNQTCFTLRNLSYVNLTVRPVKEPRRVQGTIKLLLHVELYFFFFSSYFIQILLLLHASHLPRKFSETVLSHRGVWPFHLPVEHRLLWDNGHCLELLFHNQTEKYNLVSTQQICALILRKKINYLKND